MSKQSFSRSLSQASEDAIEICRLAASGSTGHGFDLAVVDTATNLTLYYRTDVIHNGTVGAWKRLVPNKTIGPSKFTTATRTWAVDISIANEQATLRLVRTKAAAANTSVNCVVAAYGRTGETVTITGVDGQTSGATNGGTYEGTLLTELDDKLGVSTDTPSFTLDVAGDVNVSTGNVYLINGSPVLGSTSLGTTVTTSSLTSVGTLDVLSVTGNVTAGNLNVSSSISGTTLSLTGNAQTGNTVTAGVSEIWNAENQSEKWRMIVSSDASGNFFQLESFVSSEWQGYLRIDK